MSYLISGNTAEKRLEKAMEMTKNQLHASSFDTIILGVIGETSIGIEQIRSLQGQLSLKPYNSASKVAIIHPAETLTVEAQNALLKVLEEPNESSVLILTSPQADSLLPTIVSRCKIVKLETKSEIKLSNDDIATLLHCYIVTLSSGAGERLKIASEIGKGKEEIKEWLQNSLVVLREALLKSLTFTKVSVGKPNLSINDAQIVQIIRNLEKTLLYLDQNINPRLALENFILNL